MNLFSDNKPSSVGKNTIFGVAASFTNVATRLITVPVVIHYLGLKGFGTWSIIMVVANYMRLGIAGAKSGFQKYVAEAMGNGKWDYANKLLSTGSVIIIIICILGLIPLAIFSRKLTMLLGVPAEFFTPVSRSIVFLGIAMVISNTGGVFQAVIMGVHRIDIVKIILIFFTVSEAIVIILLLVSGYGLFQMTVVMATSEVLRMLSYYLISQKVCPSIHIRLSFIDKNVIHELFRFVGSYQILNVLGIFYVSLLPLATLKLYGAEAAGLLALCERLVRITMVFPEALLLPLLTAGAFAHGSGSQQKVKTLVTKTFKFSTAVSIPLLCFLAFFGIFLVYAWTNTLNYSLQPILYGVTIATFFCSIARICMVLYRSMGGATKDVIWMLFRSGVMVVGIAIAGRNSEYFIILIGYVFAELTGALYMFYISTKRISLDLKIMMQNTFKIITGTLVAISVCVIVSKHLFSDAEISRISSTILVIVLASIYFIVGILWIILTRYFSQEDKESIFSIIRPFARKLSRLI